VTTSVFRIKNEFHKVPFTWDFPGEEDVSLAGLGFYESPNWGNLFPNSFFEHYTAFCWENCESRSMEKWRMKYSYWIKKLSILNKFRRLVLKSPPNTGRVDSLIKLFPNAKFVCIHRDPIQVYASCIRFWEILDKHYSFQKLSDQRIKNIIFKSFDNTMNRFHACKDLIPVGQLVEMSYESLRENPFTRFNVLYDELNIGEFHKIENKIEEFVRATRSYPFVSYRPSNETEVELRKHWKSHIEYWENLRRMNL
jgi:hypothetical protein